MPVTGEQAIAAASSQSAHGPRFGVDQCLMRCRLAFGVKAIVHDAAMSWRMSKTQHPTTDPASIPSGVPVYWTGGSSGFGHIAVSTGDGKCWSTDIKRGGYFDLVDIAQVGRQWPKLKLVGWSETLNGERVYTPTDAVDTPAPRPNVPINSALRVDGVDLSHHNTITQAGLTAAKNAGVRWVMHKCTEGATVKDARYSTRRGMATKAGLMFGAYHFARPSNSLTDALTEAKFFLKTAQVRPGDMRPMLDLEDRGGLTRKQLTAWVGAFVAEVKAQTGVLPYIYTPFDLDDTFGCMLWVARYSNSNAAPKIPAPWKKARIRQFSNGVFGKPNKVAGLGGVDLNMMVEEGPDEPLDWHRVASKDVQPAPAPTPEPIPVESVEFRVHLVPGNKVETVAQVKGDMALVKTKSPGGSAVVFSTERQASKLQQAVSDGLGAGWVRAVDNECTIASGPAWHQAPGLPLPYAMLLAKDDPSKLLVSPKRYLDVVHLENNGLLGHPIVVAGTHLVSEANCIHTHVRGRAWREKTWPIQVQDVLREVQKLHDAGEPVVLAGDFNTGKFFTGTQLFSLLTKRFGKYATHVHNGSLDQVFLISTDTVRLTEVGVEVETNNASDHDMVTAVIRAEVA